MRLIFFYLFLSACSHRTIVCNDEVPPNGKPSVLVIGDSVSIGYTPYVRMNLPDYEIVHNRCNAMDSNNGVEWIDVWLRQREKWQAVTFNHGIWDVVRTNTPIPTYKDNLRYIGKKLLALHVSIVFFTTTQINEPSDRDVYNAAAREVMNELGIPVSDLGAFSDTMVGLHLPGDPLHWTPEGSEALGDFVTDTLNTMLH